MGLTGGLYLFFIMEHDVGLYLFIIMGQDKSIYVLISYNGTGQRPLLIRMGQNESYYCISPS
jgi:hypothetical protein